jgi:predicted component of type VI protein secretion system
MMNDERQNCSQSFSAVHHSSFILHRLFIGPAIQNYCPSFNVFDNSPMAYLILSTDGREWDRRELNDPIVMGRSPDCDISVHDILLSRRHCRFTPTGGGWLLIDLASRNGTTLGDKTVEQSKLKHGDVIRVGKTKITFRTDAFVPSTNKGARPALPPSIDRDERLTGTVFGMQVATPVNNVRPSMHRPTPKPRPMDPVSFESDNLYSMLEQIASSSWDSIYAVNAQPLRRNRTLPQPMVAGSSRAPVRQKLPPVSLSLQAMPVAHSRSPRKPAGLLHWTRRFFRIRK